MELSQRLESYIDIKHWRTWILRLSCLGIISLIPVYLFSSFIPSSPFSSPPFIPPSLWDFSLIKGSENHVEMEPGWRVDGKEDQFHFTCRSLGGMPGWKCFAFNWRWRAGPQERGPMTLYGEMIVSRTTKDQPCVLVDWDWGGQQRKEQDGENQ